MPVEEPHDHAVHFVRLGQAGVEREGRVPQTLPDVQVRLDAEADQLVVARQHAAQGEVAGAADQ